MGSVWQPEAAAVERLCSLVGAGSSVRATAGVLELPLSVTYRLTHQHQISLRQKRKTHSAEYAGVRRLWLQGLAPMDIVRASSVSSSVVYRIGIELGLWRRNPYGRRAAATTRRCGYLILHTNALSREDAAIVCGTDRHDTLDIDKGLIEIGNVRVPFVPDGPDTTLYNRLVQVTPYVDGRQAVPVHVIPQKRIDRRVSSRYLPIEECEMIFDLQRQGQGVQEIARRLGHSAGAISEELTRNRDEFGMYLPSHAHRESALRRLRPKQRKLNAGPKLREVVWMMLKGRYSPEQVSGRLRREYPDNDTIHMSSETIYQSLFSQAKDELEKEIVAVLRRGQTQRKPRDQRVPCKRFVDSIVMISDHPAEVNDRAVLGHWEGDLVLGKGNNSTVGTLVERTTRCVILLHLPDGHSAVEVQSALTETIDALPTHLKDSLTWSQGSEMAGHKALSIATDCPVYFCDPGSLWQRGSNESTNGLLRQYFPKGTDLSIYSEEDLEFVAIQLNRKPRKTPDYDAPAKRVAQLLAPAGVQEVLPRPPKSAQQGQLRNTPRQTPEND